MTSLSHAIEVGDNLPKMLFDIPLRFLRYPNILQLTLAFYILGWDIIPSLAVIANLIIIT